MTKFKQGQTVYNISGNVFLYDQLLPNNEHLAYEVVFVQTDLGHGDFEENETEGQLRIIGQLFAKPPIKKLDESIISANEEISCLKKEISLNTHAIQILKDQKATAKSDLEKELEAYPNHSALIKLSNNVMPTHSVNTRDFFVSDDTDGLHDITFNIKTGKLVCEKFVYLEGDVDFMMFYSLDDAKKWFVENAPTAPKSMGLHSVKILVDQYRKLELRVPYALLSFVSDKIMDEMNERDITRDVLKNKQTRELKKLSKEMENTQ